MATNSKAQKVQEKKAAAAGSDVVQAVVENAPAIIDAAVAAAPEVLNVAQDAAEAVPAVQNAFGELVAKAETVVSTVVDDVKKRKGVMEVLSDLRDKLGKLDESYNANRDKITARINELEAKHARRIQASQMAEQGVKPEDLDAQIKALQQTKRDLKRL